MDLTEYKKIISNLTEEELREFDNLISGLVWTPLPGPQMEAYYCEADELFYGGAAGGGKTDLLLGLALTAHQKSVIFRREATQLQGIYDRLHGEILRTRDGFNGSEKIQRLSGGRQIEFGSCPNAGDEQKFQGRPHDLKGFDEITHFIPSQYHFLRGWLRSRDKDQRKRIVCTGNPPTDSDGEWVLSHWGPWLDPDHKDPAKYGELRWFAMIDGKETQVDSGNEIEHLGEIIVPKSRTFIPSSVEDNPFLMESGYKSQLQSLPEPLRSQLLKGDFKAGIGDDPWQVLPTQWVRDAQARWADAVKSGPMDSIGCDPARGGRDETVISRRYGRYFDELLTYPGAATPDGPAVASLIVSVMRDSAPIHVDIIGIGSSVYDHLKSNSIHVVGVNNSEGSDAEDRTGRLRFRNVRAETYWKLRELLDPKNEENICLPPDPQLRADLCAPRWTLTAGGILIESKEDVKKRIGRSTDRGDAVVMASMATHKHVEMYRPNRSKKLRLIKS